MRQQSWVLWVVVFFFAGSAWADFCPSNLLSADEDQDLDGIANEDDACCFGHDRFDPDLGGGALPLGPCLDDSPNADANGNGIPKFDEGMCCAYAPDICMKASATNGCPDGGPPVPCDHLLLYTDFNPDLSSASDACFNLGQGCMCYTVVDYDRDGSGPFDNCPLIPNAVADGDQPNDDEDLWGNACDSCNSSDGNPTTLEHCYFFDDYCGPDSYCTPFVMDLFGVLQVMNFCSSPPDWDADFIADECDNCVDVPNETQADRDFDLWGDACDNCPDDHNFDQLDDDWDFIGNACDDCPGGTPDPTATEDRDSDGIVDVCDNCMEVSNDAQEDADGDGVGNLCDNCVDQWNPWQSNVDGDGPGDACDMCPGRWDDQEIWGEDLDFDGIADECDFCPGRIDQSVILGGIDEDGDGYDDYACDPCPGFDNRSLDPLDSGLFLWPWPDADEDGIADVCDRCLGHPDERATLDDEDVDQDGVPDTCDMCPTEQNFKAAVGEDRDGDGIADFCDDFVDVDTDVIDPRDDPKLWEEQDDDGDGVANGADNCPDIANTAQADGDEDGQGDACSLFDDYTGAFDCRCNGVGTNRPAAKTSLLPLITALLSTL